MKRFFSLMVVVLATLAIPCKSNAQVSYVKVCDKFGTAFQYVPGTDICVNSLTGEAREFVGTDNNNNPEVWRTFLPYPQGKWVENLRTDCGPGKLVKLGNFKSTDFLLNAFNRKQTAPVNVPVKPGEFISKVIMSGGFYDPRLPSSRSGINGSQGLCVRSLDPGLLENTSAGALNPPYGNGSLPIGCISNSRILNMPAAYSVSATAAYPNVDVFFTSDDQATVSGPYMYGKQLVVTTDLGSDSFPQLTYFDAVAQASKPLAGTVSAWVCVAETGPDF